MGDQEEHLLYDREGHILEYDGISVGIDELLNWYDRLSIAVDSIGVIGRRMKIRHVLYLYLLYRDMFGSVNGPIEDDMILLLNGDRIRVYDDGIDRTVHLYDGQTVEKYTLLIADSLKEIELSSVSDIHSPYLTMLPQLHTVTISPDEGLRRDWSDIEYDDYNEDVPDGLENTSIRVTKSDR